MTTSPSTSNSVGLFFLGLFLAAGLLGTALLLGETIVTVRSVDNTITVKGYAEQKITSDVGVWTGSFAIRAADLVSGYSRVQSDLQKVLKYLEENGVKKDWIEVQAVNTFIRYKKDSKGRNTNAIDRYDLDQRVTITASDVALIQKIAKESTQLIQQGIAFRSDPPRYFYSKINDSKISLLGAATKNARERAEQLAVNSGSQAGTLRWASQGVFQITPVNSTDVSDYGTYDTSSIEKSIKAVVTVRYGIE